MDEDYDIFVFYCSSDRGHQSDVDGPLVEDGLETYDCFFESELYGDA